STRDTAATMPQTHAASSSQAKNAGAFAPINPDLTRPSAIEPVIGQMKAKGHPAPGILKGPAADAANVILSAVGYNLRLVLAWLRIILRVILLALLQTFTIGQPSNRLLNGRLFTCKSSKTTPSGDRAPQVP